MLMQLIRALKRVDSLKEDLDLADAAADEAPEDEKLEAAADNAYKSYWYALSEVADLYKKITGSTEPTGSIMLYLENNRAEVDVLLQSSNN